jgi:polyisoprenoid-binding protein YceI
MKLITLKHLLLAALASGAGGAFAAETAYNIDPGHTYPSFEADHMGLSLWRGKFNKTSGKVGLDRAARTGTLDIVIDARSIDFGHDKMNARLLADDMFNVEKFPLIFYKSKSMTFDGDRLTAVDGELTLLGVTKPVKLKINSFKCMIKPPLQREVCGADASGEFKRTDFGFDYGVPRFAPEIKLAIQVEAIKAD